MRLLLSLCLAATSAFAQTEADFITNPRQLTFEGRRAGEGYFNADGTKMIFQSEREEGNPFYQIYLMDLETGDQERISPGMGKTTCAWIHPDGKRVLFASTHTDANSKKLQEAEYEERKNAKVRKYSWDYDEHYDIWEYSLTDKTLKNLTNTRGYDAEGGWSQANLERSADEGPYKVQYELQDMMQDLVGIVRVEDEMQRALGEIEKLKVRARKVGVAGNREYNPGWHTALDLDNLMVVSEAVTRSAIERKESRGGHFRDDYPEKDPAQQSFNIIVRKGPNGEVHIVRETISDMPDELKQVIEENK